MVKENKTVKNKFTWIPMDKRTSKFGGPVTPRKPEVRKPLLWLARVGNELFLVNSSGETLDYVIPSTGGFQTYYDSDEVVTISRDGVYKYENVSDSDAVKVEEFDEVYDSDYILQVYITVQSPKLGKIEIATPSGKGGVGEAVLLWDTGESGKYVNITKLNS